MLGIKKLNTTAYHSAYDKRFNRTLKANLELEWTVPEDNGEEVVTSAKESIKKAQRMYKHYFNLKSKQQSYKVGDLVLVRFAHKEQGKLRKLSRPWHSPYKVISRVDPDVSVVEVHFSQEPAIQVHKTRVCHCPVAFPPGYFWYGYTPPVHHVGWRICIGTVHWDSQWSVRTLIKVREDLDYPEIIVLMPMCSQW